MPSFGTPTYAGRMSGTNSLDVPVPGDLADGQLLIVALRAQESGDLPWVPPEGFVLVSPEPFLPNVSLRVGGVFVRQVLDAAAEPASYTFTGPGSRAVAIAVACTPDNVGPVASQFWGPYGGSTQSGGIVTLDHLDGVATPTPNLSIAALGAEATSGVSHVPTEIPDGYVEIGNTQSSLDESTTGSRTALWLGWRSDLSGDTEVLSGGFAGASATALYVGVFTGGGVAAPVGGFRSVAQMLSTQGATWAHRGGSADWPEMSELAFANSAAAGYGALEFSCARTSDGVWFGLHDRDLNRTSQTTGLPWASEMTWAEVQEYQITLNAGGSPQPYWTLSDFLDTYGRTHVCILDFKYASAYADEMYALAATKADRQKVVIKYHGPTTFAPSIATRVAAEGWASWGYYYESDVTDGGLAASQDKWTILGMDLTAPQSAWDAVLAYGKPVVGHIAATQTQYDTAIAKGAHMVQCSGAAVIDAVGPPANPQPWDAIYALGQRVPARTVSQGSTPIWP